MGGLLLLGDPDLVVQDVARLAALGRSGIAVSFANYLDKLPFFSAPRCCRACSVWGCATAGRSAEANS